MVALQTTPDSERVDMVVERGLCRDVLRKQAACSSVGSGCLLIEDALLSGIRGAFGLICGARRDLLQQRRPQYTLLVLTW